MKGKVTNRWLSFLSIKEGILETISWIQGLKVAIPPVFIIIIRRKAGENMQIAYCEDDRLAVERMQDMLERYGAIHREKMQLVAYLSSEEMLFECSEHYPFDCVILDIQMEGMNGMSLAHEIRKSDPHVPILFLTTEKSYVFEGYEVNAMRYLLKPLNEEQFFLVLEEVARRKKVEQHYLLVETMDKEKVRVAVGDILYLEANGHTTRIVTTTQECMCRQSFSSLTEQLNNTDMLFCHRSYFVNLKYVTRLEGNEVLMDNGDRLPVSRQKRNAFMDGLVSYYESDR